MQHYFPVLRPLRRVVYDGSRMGLLVPYDLSQLVWCDVLGPQRRASLLVVGLIGPFRLGEGFGHPVTDLFLSLTGTIVGAILNFSPRLWLA